MSGPAAADALASAAEALAGTRFRLHGRDQATGLDCLGVLAASLAAIGRPAPVPRDYALRQRALPALGEIAAACGFEPSGPPVRPGDALLARVAVCQWHLLLAVSGGRFVHAHAGLRRVVVQPGPLPWPVAEHWRLAA